MESSLLNKRLGISLYLIGGVHSLQMVHLDSTWSSCELQVDYAHTFGWATTKIKCTWSPVDLEYVGQGKVLW